MLAPGTDRVSEGGTEREMVGRGYLTNFAEISFSQCATEEPLLLPLQLLRPGRIWRKRAATETVGNTVTGDLALNDHCTAHCRHHSHHQPPF